MIFIYYCDVCGEPMYIQNRPIESTGDAIIDALPECGQHPENPGHVEGTERLVPVPPFPHP